jgi:hypothetical protein
LDDTNEIEPLNDGKRLLNNRLQIRDLESGEVIRQIVTSTMNYKLMYMMITPDDRYVVGWQNFSCLKIYVIKTGQQVTSYESKGYMREYILHERQNGDFLLIVAIENEKFTCIQDKRTN